MNKSIKRPEGTPTDRELVKRGLFRYLQKQRMIGAGPEELVVWIMEDYDLGMNGAVWMLTRAGVDLGLEVEQ